METRAVTSSGVSQACCVFALLFGRCCSHHPFRFLCGCLGYHTTSGMCFDFLGNSGPQTGHFASGATGIYTLEAVTWTHRCLVFNGPANDNGKATYMALYKSGVLDYIVSPCNIDFTPPTEALTLHSGTVPLKIDEFRFVISRTACSRCILRSIAH